MVKDNGKSATVKLSNPSPKKGSVQFSTNEQGALFTSVYLMRSGAKDHLGIPNLDSVKAIELTVKVVE